jgi:hypothetical protein
VTSAPWRITSSGSSLYPICSWDHNARWPIDGIAIGNESRIESKVFVEKLTEIYSIISEENGSNYSGAEVCITALS